MRVLFILWKTIHFVKVVCSSNHFLFEILNSNTLISDPSLKSYEVVNLPRILSFYHNIGPLPFFFLSFRNIPQPSAKNWEFRNVPSTLVSDHKQVSISLRTRSLKLENLFLIELMLRYPIITFLG